MASQNIIEVDDLSISFVQSGRQLPVLLGVSLTIGNGEAVGLVGESGSGKSTLARSLLGLLPTGVSRILGGRIKIGTRDVTHLSEKEWTSVRGRPVAIIFQDPLSFLNPVMRIGAQIAESIARHTPELPVQARVLELLRLVRLPEGCAGSYPHELSGGMRQRALLAVALGCRPSLLIADEPTTALDVTTQGEVLALLRDLREEIGMALLLISHDLGVVSSTCDRLYVMYAGQVMESGDTSAVFDEPSHPYTNGLLRAAAAVRTDEGLFSTIPGDTRTLLERTIGCPFRPRCRHAIAPCAERLAPLSAVDPDRRTHLVRCWRCEREPSPVQER